MSHGMRVTISFAADSIFAQNGSRTAVLRNVTEIHFNYNRHHHGKSSIAFESDIHGTGMTYQVAQLFEYEAVLETEKAEAF